MFRKYCIILISLFILSGCFKTTDIISNGVATDNMAYFQEKNRVYWEIYNNPDIINNKELQQKEWFNAWNDNPELKKQYIQEAIQLYITRDGGKGQY